MALTRAKRDIDFVLDIPPGAAPIGISRTWETILSGPGTFTNPSSSDTNRLGLIVISHEDSGGGATVNTVTVDGETATQVISSFAITAFSNEVTLFYLTDAQLANISDGSAINITFNNGPNNTVSVFTAILNNVSQSNPVISADEENGTGSSSGTLTAVAGESGYSVLCIADGTALAVISQDNTSYVEVFSGDTGTEFTTDLLVYENTLNETINSTWTISAGLREVSFIVNLRSA